MLSFDKITHTKIDRQMSVTITQMIHSCFSTTPSVFLYKGYQEVSRRTRCGVNAAKINVAEVNTEAAWCMAACNASIRKPAWPRAAVFSCFEVHGRMQRFHPKSFSLVSRWCALYIAEKQKIVIRLINENGGSLD